MKGTNLHQKQDKPGGRSTMLLAAVGALCIAIGFVAVNLWEVRRVESSQRSQIIELSDSFSKAFRESRGVGADVTATFRRIGIEHFSENRTESTDGVRKNIRIVGLPGQELRTRERGQRLRDLVLGLGAPGQGNAVEELRMEEGRIIGRHVHPIRASDKVCASCHNTLLGRAAFEPGDVMGAYIVESDLTEAVWRILFYASIAFLLTLAVFSLLARREQRRMGQMVDALKARVYLEQAKAEAETQAAFLLSHDALTGLANRTMLGDRLQDELSIEPTADILVGAIDLDDFKEVNDTMGHAAGDGLLTEVANRLTDIIDRSGGLVARPGGDEFSFVLRLGDAFAGAAHVGQAVLDAMAGEFHYENNVIKPKCSIGLAVAADLDLVSADELLKAADAALYSAKARGKNLYRMFDDEIRDSLWRRRMIAAKLPEAVRGDSIRAVLQPKICMQTGAFRGFEALARWHSANEDIPPQEFSVIAEEIGLIRDLDLAVLRSAATFSVQQEAETGQAIPISSNISALNFRSGGLAEAIQDVLWQVGLPAERLTLEVTESTAVENWRAVQSAVEMLRQAGVRISLDDFGTGYSSLSYLRRFGFEEIKIDRDFIVNVASDAETRFLFESIVDMATGLGSSVVVEGIETEEQARIVAAKGPVIGQGYLFSKPLEMEQAAEYLQQKFSNAA